MSVSQLINASEISLLVGNSNYLLSQIAGLVLFANGQMNEFA